MQYQFKKRITDGEYPFYEKEYTNQMDGCLVNKSIKIRGFKLRARAILFDGLSNLHKYRRKIGFGCYPDDVAFCDSLTVRGIKFGKGIEIHTDYFDRKYFAVMTFSLHKLSQGIIAHECAHAAFFYDKRCPESRKLWWHEREIEDVKDDPIFMHENVCYVSGFLVDEVNKAFAGYL